MTDKESFAKYQKEWSRQCDQWPTLSLVQNKLEQSLKSHGLFLLKTPAMPESLELKEKLKNFLKGLGTLLNQSPEGCDLFEVKNEGFQPGHPKFRGPSSNRQLSFHTDRCDLIIFYCVRAADSGGLNQFIKAKTVYDSLAEENPELLKVLEAPFIYKRHNADPANPNNTYKLPVFDKVGSRLSVTLMTYLIERAAQDPKLPSLSSSQKEALEAFQEICQRPENQLQVKLEPGDILFLDNTKMLHSRSAFEDTLQKRLYYRAWLAVPWSEELPKSFKVLFGNTQAGSIRGGFRRLD